MLAKLTKLWPKNRSATVKVMMTIARAIELVTRREASTDEESGTSAEGDAAPTN